MKINSVYLSVYLTVIVLIGLIVNLTDIVLSLVNNLPRLLNNSGIEDHPYVNGRVKFHVNKIVTKRKYIHI